MRGLGMLRACVGSFRELPENATAASQSWPGRWESAFRRLQNQGEAGVRQAFQLLGGFRNIGVLLLRKSSIWGSILRVPYLRKLP